MNGRISEIIGSLIIVFSLGACSFYPSYSYGEKPSYNIGSIIEKCGNRLGQNNHCRTGKVILTNPTSNFSIEIKRSDGNRIFCVSPAEAAKTQNQSFKGNTSIPMGGATLLTMGASGQQTQAITLVQAVDIQSHLLATGEFYACLKYANDGNLDDYRRYEANLLSIVANVGASSGNTSNASKLLAAPTNVTATQGTSAGTITVKFTPPTPPTGTRITGYKILLVGNDRSTNVTPAFQTPAPISGLTKGVKYRFAVAATSSIGDSPYSKTTIATPAP